MVLMTGQRAGKAGGLGKGSGQARDQAEGFRAHATHLDARGILLVDCKLFDKCLFFAESCRTYIATNA